MILISQTEEGFEFTAKEEQAASIVNILMHALEEVLEADSLLFIPDNHHGDRKTGKVDYMSMHDLVKGEIVKQTDERTQLARINRNPITDNYRIKILSAKEYSEMIIKQVKTTV